MKYKSRKLARSVARYNMEKAGITRYNKHYHTKTEFIPSYFSRHWKTFV